MKELRRILKIALVVSAVVTALASAVLCGTFRVIDAWERPVREGVTYYHYRGEIDSKPVHAYLLHVNASRPDLRIKPILAYDRVDRLETVVSMVRRTGALAAVNGSFFNRKSAAPYPVGFLMAEGRPVYFTSHTRSAFGMTGDRYPLFGYPKARGIVYLESQGRYINISGMNHPRKANTAVVYTSEYGERTRTNSSGREVVVEDGVVTALRVGDSAIPRNGFVLSLHGTAKKRFDDFSPGDMAGYYFIVEDRWVNAVDIVTGGPLLLYKGMLGKHQDMVEKLYKGTRSRIPQTAIGAFPDGRMALAVVDGRQKKYSVGMTYMELAEFLYRLGVVNAVGMDGGGSSTMVIGDSIVNKPSDGGSRAVNNAIGVFRAGSE